MNTIYAGAHKPNGSELARPDGHWRARSVPGVIATMSDEVLASLGAALARGVAEQTEKIRHDAAETAKEAEALSIRIGALETERAERDVELRKAMLNLMNSVQAVLVLAGQDPEVLPDGRETPTPGNASNILASVAVDRPAGGLAGSEMGRARNDTVVPVSASMVGRPMSAKERSIPAKPMETLARSGAATALQPHGKASANPGATSLSIAIELPCWIVEAIDALVASGKHLDRREAVVEILTEALCRPVADLDTAAWIADGSRLENQANDPRETDLTTACPIDPG